MRKKLLSILTIGLMLVTSSFTVHAKELLPTEVSADEDSSNTQIASSIYIEVHHWETSMIDLGDDLVIEGESGYFNFDRTYYICMSRIKSADFTSVAKGWDTDSIEKEMLERNIDFNLFSELSNIQQVYSAMEKYQEIPSSMTIIIYEKDGTVEDFSIDATDEYEPEDEDEDEDEVKDEDEDENKSESKNSPANVGDKYKSENTLIVETDKNTSIAVTDKNNTEPNDSSANETDKNNTESKNSTSNEKDDNKSTPENLSVEAIKENETANDYTPEE